MIKCSYTGSTVENYNFQHSFSFFVEHLNNMSISIMRSVENNISWSAKAVDQSITYGDDINIHTHNSVSLRHREAYKTTQTPHEGSTQAASRPRAGDGRLRNARGKVPRTAIAVSDCTTGKEEMSIFCRKGAWPKP